MSIVCPTCPLDFHHLPSVILVPLSPLHKGTIVLRYCRNVCPTWVKFDSKDTKESGVVFEVLSTKSKKRT